MTIIIDAILGGQPARFTDQGDFSAIAKTPLGGSVRVGFLGLEGDAQADLSVHGGPDKAIHHYPRDHYPFWQDALGNPPLLDAAGAFGENVSTRGIDETVVCIGDRFRLGTALVEISQGRQPCWKLDHRFDGAKVLARVVRTGRSGWYYRVIEEGAVTRGDALDLVERPEPAWSVARVFALLIAGGAKGDPAAVRALAELAPLSESWRKRAAKLADALG